MGFILLITLLERNVVDQFNGKAFRVQLQDGIGYVICRDRKLLEKLLKEP